MISISVTTYNRKKLTKFCIESIIKNTPRDIYELIVVDNGSTDGTRQLLVSYPEIDILILNNENRHMGLAINQAWKLASPCEWLVSMANDEFAMPGWFENFCKVTRDLNPDFVFCLPREANFHRKKVLKTPSGGYHLGQLDRPEVGASLAIKYKDLHRYDLWFPEQKWSPRFGSQYSVMLQKFKQCNFTKAELWKPSILSQNCRFNDPEYNDYYQEVFGIRGRMDRLGRLREKDGYSDRYDEYYAGSGYDYKTGDWIEGHE